MPLVSVVVATVNYGHFLGECLESIKAQTFRDFEIIVVDAAAGSTDNTREVVAKYADVARYIRQDGKGLANARNCGIRAARGEYIAFLDADDLWLPQKLELQLCRFQEYPQAGLVYAQIYSFDDRTGSLLSVHPLQRQCPEGRVLQSLLMHQFIMTPAPLVKSEVFHVVGYFDESLGASEDWDMWLMAAAKYDFACVKQPLAKHRVHPVSLCATVPEERIGQDTLRVLEKAISSNPGELGPLKRLRLGTYEREVGWRMISLGNVELGRHHLRQAMRWMPGHLLTYVCLVLSYLGPQVTKERYQAAYANYRLGRHSLFNLQLADARRQLLTAIWLNPFANMNLYGGLILTFLGRGIVLRLRQRLGLEFYKDTRRPEPS